MVSVPSCPTIRLSSKAPSWYTNAVLSTGRPPAAARNTGKSGAPYTGASQRDDDKHGVGKRLNASGQADDYHRSAADLLVTGRQVARQVGP